MRKCKIPIFAVGMFALLLCASPSVAQEGGAETSLLSEASVAVTPSEDGADVVERITLVNTDTLDGESIEHVVAKPSDVEIEDVSVTSDGRELETEVTSGEFLDRVLVSPSADAGEEFVYEVAYSYPETVEQMKVPLVVPAYPTDAVESNVSVEVVLPEGKYLSDSFPLLESGRNGTATASMVSFPSYSSFTMSGSPSSLLTIANAYTALALLIIAGCCASLIFFERRRGAQKVAHEEVADV